MTQFGARSRRRIPRGDLRGLGMASAASHTSSYAGKQLFREKTAAMSSSTYAEFQSGPETEALSEEIPFVVVARACGEKEVDCYEGRAPATPA